MLVYYVFTYIGFIRIEKRNSMNITQETIKENKQKILDLEVLYRRTGTMHIYKTLAEILGVSNNMIFAYEKNGQLKDKLELLFESAKNFKGSEIEFSELQKLIEQSNKRMKRGIGAKPLLESEIRDAQSKSISAFAAARTLGISYNTYKKYAKRYGIFENLKKSRKNFTYCLSINTHLPFFLTKEQKEDTAFIKFGEIYKNKFPNEEVLGMYYRMNQELISIANLINKSDVDKVLIIGDHAPPYIFKNERNLFATDYVPSILIEKKN
jgi:transcriptional regulator with XRE-family HTH domain